MCFPPALAGLFTYFLDLPTEGFSTQVAFPPLSRLSSRQRLLCLSVASLSFSQPLRHGGLSHLAGTGCLPQQPYLVPPPAPSARTSPGALFLEHWLAFLLPAFPPSPLVGSDAHSGSLLTLELQMGATWQLPDPPQHGGVVASTEPLPLAHPALSLSLRPAH